MAASKTKSATPTVAETVVLATLAPTFSKALRRDFESVKRSEASDTAAKIRAGGTVNRTVVHLMSKGKSAAESQVLILEDIEAAGLPKRTWATIQWWTRAAGAAKGLTPESVKQLGSQGNGSMQALATLAGVPSEIKDGETGETRQDVVDRLIEAGTVSTEDVTTAVAALKPAKPESAKSPAKTAGNAAGIVKKYGSVILPDLDPADYVVLGALIAHQQKITTAAGRLALRHAVDEVLFAEDVSTEDTTEDVSV